MLRKAKVRFRKRKRPAANNPINSTIVTVESDVQTPGSTQFVNEAVSRVAKRVSTQCLPESLHAATKTGAIDDIHSFLAKPAELAHAIWDTQAAGDLLLTLSTPVDILAYPLFAQKVRGFFGFKATTVIRMQVNSNKFQQGRLLMVFVPQAGIADTYPGIRLRSLMAATQLPRVELDLSLDTQVTMEIPYVNPCAYFNMWNESNPIGKVYVLIYSPLATGTGGSDHVDISLWASFKDVELVTPTFIPEMGRPSKAVASQESDEVAYRSMSSILSKGASIAQTFSGVPMLASIAGPTNWFLTAASKAAAAFGYSKPILEDPLMKVYTVGQLNMMNYDGNEVVPVMATCSNHSVGVLPCYAGTEHDEMAISHIASIPAFVTAVTWNDTMSHNVLLWKTEVEPNAFSSVGTAGLRQWKDTIPAAYLSNSFNYWRGSFIITFKIVKTAYHSGRLLFAFNPGFTGDISLDDSQFCMREIIDVREKTEWTFTVPFVSTRQYHVCDLPNSEHGTAFDATGSISLFVLNELVRPASAADFVQILIEVSAGPDYELMSPRDSNQEAFIQAGWQTQMGDVIGPTASGTIDCTQCNVGVGNATVASPSLDPALYCAGERILSILQLMKRYTPMRFQDDVDETTGKISGWAVRPYEIGYIRETEGSPLPASSGPFGDPYCTFGCMFAYNRGSVKIGFLNIESVYGSSSDNPWYLGATLDFDGAIRSGRSVTYLENEALYVPPQLGRTIRFLSAPNYNENYCRLNRPNTGTNVSPLDQFSSHVRLFGFQIPTRQANILLFRSVGEDFNFGYFLGTPRTVPAPNLS